MHGEWDGVALVGPANLQCSNQNDQRVRIGCACEKHDRVVLMSCVLESTRDQGDREEPSFRWCNLCVRPWNDVHKSVSADAENMGALLNKTYAGYTIMPEYRPQGFSGRLDAYFLHEKLGIFLDGSQHMERSTDEQLDSDYRFDQGVLNAVNTRELRGVVRLHWQCKRAKWIDMINLGLQYALDTSMPCFVLLSPGCMDRGKPYLMTSQDRTGRVMHEVSVCVSALALNLLCVLPSVVPVVAAMNMEPSFALTAA